MVLGLVSLVEESSSDAHCDDMVEERKMLALEIFSYLSKRCGDTRMPGCQVHALLAIVYS